MTTLYIHAPNVHHGGGGILLLDLLRAARTLPIKILLVVDSRMVLPEDFPSSITIKKVNGNILGRLLAEFSLKMTAQRGDIVLCFGNLPPLFRLPSMVVTYVQNRFLADSESIKYLSPRTRLRITLEKIWLHSTKNNSDKFLVQTPTMKVHLSRFLRNVQDINVAPFYGWEPSNEICVHKYDFIYVASGELHKNHDALIEAWRILSCESLFPTLALTIDGRVFSGLAQHLDGVIKKFNLKIINLGMVSSSEIAGILKSSSALIYPSKIESFGMPLIEAQILNIPVIASELDYVRDVVVPSETFDPNSPLSIARAVKRFLKIDSENCVLANSSDFLVSILKFRQNL